jgi:hypothetical protein
MHAPSAFFGPYIPPADLTSDRITSDDAASIGEFGRALARGGFVADAIGNVIRGTLRRDAADQQRVGAWTEAVGEYVMAS